MLFNTSNIVYFFCSARVSVMALNKELIINKITVNNIFSGVKILTMSKPTTASRGHKGNRILKVMLLGDGGVGKSSLMNVFANNKFDPKTYHTIGVEFLIKDITVDNQTYALQIWDTAGQERFKSLRTPFYHGADCCLLTFSLDDAGTFRDLPQWRKEFFYYADVSEASAFPLVVLGNKLDVPDRQVCKEEAQAWCDSISVPYFETSAKNAINVDAAFIAVVRRAKELEKEVESSQRMNLDTIKLKQNQTDSKEKQGCY